MRGQASDAALIREAASAMREGGLVVFPTETVYGVGCDAENGDAVRRIYRAKGRPSDKPLAWYLSSLSDITAHVEHVPALAARLMDCFWPGPLTIILGGAGFRVPDDLIALALIREAGVRMIGTSANKSGQASPVSGRQASAAMDGLADIVLSAGKTRYGRESTIIDCDTPIPRIVRQGVVGREEIEEVLRVKCEVIT